MSLPYPSFARLSVMLSVIALTTVPAATTLAAPSATAGKASFTVCAACHGQNGEGNPAMNAPKLAGQDPTYLTRQLQMFKQSMRGATTGDTWGAMMRPNAATLVDDAAVANVVAYIGTFASTPAPTTITGNVQRGANLYPVCGACHGDRGEGKPAMNGPSLAGQYDWYLVRQVKNFQTGIRGANPNDTYGTQMASMANTLGDDQSVLDVVAYLNSLQQ